MAETPNIAIHSRRYLGAKTRMLDFLEEVITAASGEFTTFWDAFAGTGVVAHRFQALGKTVTASDLLLCNATTLRAFLGSRTLPDRRIVELLHELESVDADGTGADYFVEHFGGTFFDTHVARQIGAARDYIAAWAVEQRIDVTTHQVLLASLLYATDRAANTCGHFDAYCKTAPKVRELRLLVPEAPRDGAVPARVFLRDANVLAQGIVSADVVYCDLPYNSRQYSDGYHLLENLARWTCGPVEGKAGKLVDRKNGKSAYCSRVKAAAALQDFVSRVRCKHLFLSYSNMGDKGDPRSNACIADEDIWRILQSRGGVTVHERAFPHFSAGKREIEGHSERVFHCRITTAPGA